MNRYAILKTYTMSIKKVIERPDFIDVYIVNLRGREWKAFKKELARPDRAYQMIDPEKIIKRYYKDNTLTRDSIERLALWQTMNQIKTNLNDSKYLKKDARPGRSVWYRVDNTDEETLQSIIEMMQGLTPYTLQVFLVDATGTTQCIRPYLHSLI